MMITVAPVFRGGVMEVLIVRAQMETDWAIPAEPDNIDFTGHDK